MRVVFRTDSSFEIGSGHLIRCLTLAAALRAEGSECLFICRDHEGNHIDRIRKESFAIDLLPAVTDSQEWSDYPVLSHAHWLGTCWRRDAQETIQALHGSLVDWLIVDHYALDKRWESQLRPYVRKIMVIDDLADREHDCELLLDQNLVVDFETRYDLLLPPRCVRLLGPKYALLQPEYAEMRSCTPSRRAPVRRIFVYFGGSDLHNLTGLTISAFLKLNREDLELDVVIDRNNPNAAGMRSQAASHRNITLHESAPTLAPLMARADLAIGAGGATSWERCCLGLPAIVITVAENQKPIAKSLDSFGLISWIGSYEDLTIEKLVEALKKTLVHLAFETSSRSCAQLVDAMGTWRVTSNLRLRKDSRLQARPATLADEAFLLTSAMKLNTTENAFQQNATDTSNHNPRFYQKLRAVDEYKIYIIEADGGYPIGYVQFKKTFERWLISYTLVGLAHQLRLDQRVLATAINTLRKALSGPLLLGGIIFVSKRFDYVSEPFESQEEMGGETVAFCSDSDSWINDTVSEIIAQLLGEGKQCCWAHNAQDLFNGTVCFYLSYGRLVSADTRIKFNNNLVVHASSLPKGRGWSPASWQILEGREKIPVTLFEAVDRVDAGRIYDQRWINVDRTDLLVEWQGKIAQATRDLVLDFVKSYPRIPPSAREQVGEPTYYPKRKPEDSRLDIRKTIAEQFRLFQIVDNDKYPAFFEYGNKKFYLRIYKEKPPSDEKNL
jgi:UDP-2,4-diacetamido-2,4,6-trideoxy-beta-L-altropyranose hydrolase